MSYNELFEFTQKQNPHISRKVLLPEVKRLSGINRIQTVKTGVNTGVFRGLWLTPQNVEHPLVNQMGCHIILLARDMNHCWERFVYVKELMHVFDAENAKTNTPELFESLIDEFVAANVTPSEQMLSEFASFWRALGILCPEALREQFERERRELKIDDYEIALRLKIPQQYVPRLFEPRYKTWLERLKA
uniref:hypothetical protein n=1 Tax=Yoonia sp. TaxID=2212373 RepID=UPI004047C81A